VGHGSGPARGSAQRLGDVQRNASNLIKDIGARGRIAENDTPLQNLIEQQEKERRTLAQHFKQLAELEGLSILERHEIKSQGYEALANLDDTFSLQRSKVVNAAFDAAGKIQQAIQEEIIALRSEAGAIGLTGAALADLTTSQITNIANTRILKGEHGAMVEQWAKEKIAIEQLKRAQDSLGKASTLLTRGFGATSDFQQAFGVKLGAQKDLEGFNLGKLFVSNFQAFKDNPSEQGALREAFKSFVSQSLAGGITDPQELLLSLGLSAANLERLKSSLDGPLRAAFESTSEAGQQWSSAWEARFQKFTEGAANAGFGLAQIEEPLKRIVDTVRQDLAFQIDTDPALQNLLAVDAALDGLIAKIFAVPPLIIPVFFSESPRRPFGEFLPTMERRFTELDSLVSRATPQIDFEMPHARQAEYIPPPSRIVAAPSAGFREWDAPSRASNAQSTSSQERSRGEGPVNINLDLRGAHVDRGFLDRDLIPALERMLEHTTGKDSGFRVFG